MSISSKIAFAAVPRSFALALSALALSSLSALSGCAGDGADPIVADSATTAGDDDAPPSPSSPPASPSSPISPPASPDPGSAKPTRTIPPHCDFNAFSPLGTICLETAEGEAGDVIDLEVHFRAGEHDSCSIADQLYGLIVIDPAYFELVNAGSHVDCTTRSQIPDANDPSKELITWQKFGSDSIPGCAQPIAAGEVDVIQVRIKPGTPPGDYSLAWDTSDILASDQTCSTNDNHIGTEVRVLP